MIHDIEPLGWPGPPKAEFSLEVCLFWVPFSATVAWLRLRQMHDPINKKELALGLSFRSD